MDSDARGGARVAAQEGEAAKAAGTAGTCRQETVASALEENRREHDPVRSL